MRGRIATAVAVAAATAGFATTSHAPNLAAPTVASASESASSVVAAGGSETPAPGAERSGDSLYPNNGNGGYDVAHYAIAITYNPATRTLTGTDVITARATQALSRYSLDLHALTAESVTVDGNAATSAHTADMFRIVVRGYLWYLPYGRFAGRFASVRRAATLIPARGRSPGCGWRLPACGK